MDIGFSPIEEEEEEGAGTGVLAEETEETGTSGISGTESEGEAEPEGKGSLTISALGSGATKDLQEYIDEVNAIAGEQASITVALRSSSDGEITETDDSGNLLLATNTIYHLSLSVSSSTGFEAGATYTYTIPENLSAQAASGTITTEDGTEIGTWSVMEDGTVTMEFNDSAGDYQNVETTFTIPVTIQSDDDSVTIGGTIYVLKQNTNLAVNKSGNYSGYTKSDYYYGRTYEIEFSQSGVPLAGTKVTDYATDTLYSLLYTGGDISYDNQHFDTSIPLTITIVNASGTAVYTWTVDWSDSSLVLYTLDEDGNVIETTSTSDRIIGWQYTFPDTVSATDSSGDVVTVDLAADWSQYEVLITNKTVYDEVPSTSNPRLTYHNWVEVDNGIESDTAHTSVAQSTGTYSLRKDWSRGEDGLSINWTVTATIPGGTVASYEISDNMYVDKMNTSGYQIFADCSENLTMAITISEGTTINGAEIEAGTYTVYDISGDVPEDALFVYHYVASTSGITAYFVLGMACHCDADYCDGWDEDGCENILYTSAGGTKYCTCWQLDQSASIRMAYTTPKDKMMALLSKYGYNTSKLYNYSDLRKGTYNGERSLTGTSVLSAYTANVGLALASKTLEEIPGKDNSYHASYSIVINQEHYQLADGEGDLVITDNLSDSLTFLPGSLVIQATETNGDIYTLTNDDFIYTYDSDTHVITITIYDPGARAYSITYDVQILNPSAGTTYSNSAVISWQGEDLEVDTDPSYLSEVTSTGINYTVTVLKTDKDTGKLLPGAGFALCEADGTEKASGTTDENGQVTFQTISGGQESVTFSPHTLYYIEETDAPEGYGLDSTKHWFYFCDTDDGECDACDAMGLSGDVIKLVYGGVITVSDEKNTGSIKIIKYGENGELLSGVAFQCTGTDTEMTGTTSNTDGSVTFSGLKAGTYTITETQTQDGYALLTEEITVTLPLAYSEQEVMENGMATSGDGIVYDGGTYYYYNLTYEVNNSQALTLPGSGVPAFPATAALGGALVSSGFLYQGKKRKKHKPNAGH